MTRIDGIAVASIGAGVIFCYAGITGRSALASIQSLILGKSPSKLATANQISGTGNPNASPDNSATISGGSVNGTAIAQKAVTYQGHAYVYGGAPGANGSGPWDCSSFVNWVLGHDFGLHIPGSPWNPATHGATAADYLGWNGAKTIPRGQVAAGDLCVWSTHIGIALNNSQMISALNPSLGTRITGIENGGPQGESLTCRRIG